METTTDIYIINQMLDVEKNACQIIQEAKEKGNKLIAEARDEAKRIIEATQKDLDQKALTLEQELREETEKEVERIKANKQNAIEMIEKQSILKKELAIKKLRKFLFKYSWNCSLY